MQAINKPSNQVCGGLTYPRDEHSFSAVSMTPRLYANGKPVFIEYRKYDEMSIYIFSMCFRKWIRKQISV
jgi:hypothetical protein